MGKYTTQPSPVRVIAVRLPEPAIQKINEIIEDGYVFSRSDFVRTAVLDALKEHERLHPTTD